MDGAYVVVFLIFLRTYVWQINVMFWYLLKEEMRQKRWILYQTEISSHTKLLLLKLNIRTKYSLMNVFFCQVISFCFMRNGFFFHFKEIISFTIEKCFDMSVNEEAQCIARKIVGIWYHSIFRCFTFFARRRIVQGWRGQHVNNMIF